MDEARNFSAYVKVILWTYLIPGVILIYISITLKFDVKQLVAFVAVYLVVVTAFNIFLAKYHSPQSRNPQGVSVISTNDTIQPGSSSSSQDSPPSYQDVNKDPPPYASLKYYWRMITKTPKRSSSTRSRNVKFHPSGDLENPSEVQVASEPPPSCPPAEDELVEGKRLSLKRIASSPY